MATFFHMLLPGLLALLLPHVAVRSLATGELADIPEDLEDDECTATAGDGDYCALVALQRRSLRSSSGTSPAAAEDSEGGIDRKTGAYHIPKDRPLKILFVGNSFTYGPPPADREDKRTLNNLPRFFKLIAESLGDEVMQEEDTIGGCTLQMHRPSYNPEACGDPEMCQPIDLPRVNSSSRCTIPSGIRLRPTYSPCPQKLMRQEDGAWDVIVLQEQSYLPTMQAARDVMYHSTVEEFAAVTNSLESHVRRHRPLIALYMTWPYLNGNPGRRPGRTEMGCWPVGSPLHLAHLSGGARKWSAKINSAPCQGYALAQGIASGLQHGGDVVVPAGFAWLVARGSPEIPSSCKDEIDQEYDFAPPLANLDMVLNASNARNVRWSTPEEAIKLYRYRGPDYKSKFCEDLPNCHVDHHPSEVGMYLNALVFYATLFKKSPIGAAWPDGKTSVDGMVLPKIDEADAVAMQHIAHDVVMGNMDMWWRSETKARDPCAAGNCG